MSSQFVAAEITMPMSANDFQNRMENSIADYMAAADILGRLHVIQAMKARTGIDVPLNTMTTFEDNPRQVLGFERVPPKGAIERIRNLTSYTKLAFDALQLKYRLSAFTVSGISDVAVIEKVQAILLDTAQSGGTVEDFKRAVNRMLTEAAIEKLTDSQMSTIFQTNIQRAYQDGRYEQLKDEAVTIALPYWVYATVGDNRVRPAHAALDGFTAKHDDKVWRKIYPPTGFNCRCTVYAIGAANKKNDWDVPGLDRLPQIAVDKVPEAGFERAA